MTQGASAVPSGAPESPVAPDYAGDVLARVLPAAAGAVGVELPGRPAWRLPPARRCCVVLVDGLGWNNLTDRASRAPFLRGLLPTARVLTAGAPSTTVTSMASFGTGLPPGRHGLVGYETLDPATGRLLNGLHWDPAVDPVQWQPESTLFEQLDTLGVPAVRIGPARFDGSGLTQAALRGGRFRGADRLSDGCSVAAAELDGGARLVYLYWGGVDFAGHVHGWRSRQWRDALADVDRALGKLYRALPADTLLVVTADHGMVDLDHSRRHDLAATPELLAGVRVVGGETRFLQVYVEPGRTDEVAARFGAAFGDRAWVRSRDEAVAAGWFGPVDPRVEPRIGDVLVAAAGEFGVVDSRVAEPKLLAMVGQHGSLTAVEQHVPLLTVMR